MIQIFASSNSRYFVLRRNNELSLYRVPARLWSKNVAGLQNIIGVGNRGDVYFRTVANGLCRYSVDANSDMEIVPWVNVLLQANNGSGKVEKVVLNSDGTNMFAELTMPSQSLSTSWRNFFGPGEKSPGSGYDHIIYRVGNTGGKVYSLPRVTTMSAHGEFLWAVSREFTYLVTAELQKHLIAQMKGEVADWSSFADLEDDALWEGLLKEMPELQNSEAFKPALTDAAKAFAAAAAAGEALPEEAEAEQGAETFNETQADYSYFTPSEALAKEQADNAEAYETLKAQLVAIIPDLAGLSDKLQGTLRANVEAVVWPGSLDFTARYDAYVAHGAASVLTGGAAFTMKLASLAEALLLASIALLLLGLVMYAWEPLTKRFGVPRTIIALFFIYLCLLSELYNISVPMMLGNVLERMTMYGVLVLAMMPGIQCGIGLNMGMTIGCISGLLGIVFSLQFNMTGFPALIFSCLSGALISLPLGWAYSKLLNRMKGNEMTISTYVGFSFVSLMCIGWMLLPFNNPRIIWLLSGRGLRVTHSLLGSFAHLLDNFLSFKVLGVEVPTGGLLFLGLCCLLMWLFSRSRTGIAMTAVGSNARFAEASGINVNHMRTVGTVLSTMIAAIGIVIYSQAFGYAQLYTAPRQLGFIAASAILIGGATVSKARVSHVLLGVFLFEGVLVFGQQIANSVVAGGGLSEVMRIMISNGIILYALTQSGGGSRE